MLPLRYAARWQFAGAALLLAVFGVALLPDLGPVRQLALLNDKWLHGLTFAVLAAWFSGQYARRAYGWIAAGLLLFGGLIEGAQYLTAYRLADWRDVLANTAGIVAGLVAAIAGLGGWSMRVEDWLAGRAGDSP